MLASQTYKQKVDWSSNSETQNYPARSSQSRSSSMPNCDLCSWPAGMRTVFKHFVSGSGILSIRRRFGFQPTFIELGTMLMFSVPCASKGKTVALLPSHCRNLTRVSQRSAGHGFVLTSSRLHSPQALLTCWQFPDVVWIIIESIFLF